MVLLMLCCGFGCASDPATKKEPFQGQLMMPDSIRAGEDFTLSLSVKPAGAVLLLCSGTQGNYIIALPSVADTSILLKQTISGWQSWKLIAGGQLLANRSLLVQALDPVTPVQGFAGPKALVTGSEEFSSITVVPEDRYGNMVKDSLPVLFSLLRQQAKQETEGRYLMHGFSSKDVKAGNKAGKIFAGVRVAGAFSEEKELLEVAGKAMPFRISMGASLPYADGRQTFRVFSTVLADVSGNRLPDGSLVQFICQDADNSTSKLNASTISGIAEISLQAPEQPGDLKVTAFAPGGATSNELVIPFASPFTAAPSLSYEASGAVLAGPLKGPLGQLMPEGAVLLLKLKGKVMQAVAEKGFARFNTGRIHPGKYEAVLHVPAATFHVLLTVQP